MSQVTTTKTVNAEQLAAELGAAVTVTDDGAARTVTCEVPEPQLQTAVDAHSADPLWSNSAKVRNKIEQRIAQAENAYANWSTLSNAQKDTALRETMLMTAKIARYLLGRFDAAE